MTVGALEAIVVLSVVLLLIGPRRIVAMGRSLGRGVRDFKLEFGGDKESGELGGDKESGELGDGQDGEKPPRKG